MDLVISCGLMNLVVMFFQCTKWSRRFNKLDVFQLTKEYVCFNRLVDLKWHQIGCVWMDVSMVW